MTDNTTKQPPPLPPWQGAPEDFVHRAVVLFGQQRLPEVVKVCRLGLLADPRRLDGRLVLGRALMALSKYDDVLAETGAILEQDPDNYRGLLLKVEALARKKDYVQARSVLEHVEDLDPLNHQAGQLLEYLDEELERAGGPVAHVTTSTRRYPMRKAQKKETTETGGFLEQSTDEALRELSTRGGEASVLSPEPVATAATGELEDDWEAEESTVMDRAPSFEEEEEDSSIQQTPTWDGASGAGTSALQAAPTWEGSVTGQSSALLATVTVEDPLGPWDGGGEVECSEGTLAEGDDAAWDGGGEVERSEGTLAEGDDATWDGGGEVEGMEPTVTEGEPKTSK